LGEKSHRLLRNSCLVGQKDRGSQKSRRSRRRGKKDQTGPEYAGRIGEDVPLAFEDIHKPAGSLINRVNGKGRDAEVKWNEMEATGRPCPRGGVVIGERAGKPAGEDAKKKV